MLGECRCLVRTARRGFPGMDSCIFSRCSTHSFTYQVVQSWSMPFQFTFGWSSGLFCRLQNPGFANDSSLRPQPSEQIQDSSSQDQLNPLPNSYQVRQAHSPIHKHKRAISAPNFFRYPHLPVKNRLGTLPGLLPQGFTRPGPVVMSSEGGSGQEQAPAVDAAPIIPPPPFISSNIESSQPQANSLVRCEKDPNCDMETPPRKMISQYFGRNKSCTKAIPRHVWLHFCRRHYQRERYQRGPDFPKEQIKWLLEQIRRIQSWSDENVARGQASGVLQGWKLQLRKREVDRQSRNNADSDDEDGVTPVPQWLLGKADHNYGTEEILAMMGRLRDEILADKLKGMPEIEILPDITAHHKAPPKKRTARVSKAHRRVKSQGAPRTSVGGSSGVLPGLPSIPAVAASAGPAAPLGTSNTAPIVPVGTFTTATPNTLPELNSSRRSSLGSSHAFSAGGSPPRAEKRKAEESLEASATPPSIRRPALPHRPVP